MFCHSFVTWKTRNQHLQCVLKLKYVRDWWLWERFKIGHSYTQFTTTFQLGAHSVTGIKKNHAPLNFDAVLTVGCWHKTLLLRNFFFYFYQSLVFPLFLMQRLLHKSQGIFFPSYRPASHFPVPAASECHTDIALPWTSVPFQTASIFLSLPLPGPSPKQCTFLFSAKKAMWHIWKRRYFSAGGLWKAQVWSCLDDWLIQGVSSLVSRWRVLFTLFQNLVHGSHFMDMNAKLTVTVAWINIHHFFHF